MSNKEKFIGEAPLSESPKGKLKFIIPDKTIKNKHLDDDSVDTRVIKDKTVTPEKLFDSVPGIIVAPIDEKYNGITNSLDRKYTNITNELYDMVRSLQVGGVALSGQFGDRTDIGIHQRTLTKAIGRLWDELGTITGKTYMDFTLTVQPTMAYTESATQVTITADCSGSISDFDSIKIYIDNVLVAESSDIEVFSTTQEIGQTSIVKAVGTILGKTITKQQQVVKEMPFFMGSGNVYTDVMTEECRKELVGTLEGDYDVTIKNTGEYMFIIIPISHKDEFRRADMNGLGLKVEIPMEATVTSDYVVYKSLNTYKAGIYNIDIDINS